MAFCTNCGAILYKDDAEKHVCVEANIPTKGKEKISVTTEKIIG